MKLPFYVDLTGKVAAITGAGGVICSEFARALAACGAKVALLDINEERAAAYAAEIGENAIAVRCNCLDKKNIEEAKKLIGAKWGKVNLLINGAGGNKPSATCDNETMTPELGGVKDFF
ncbi:MAG: SDR family NAD(P)-dependent oxidoreductase, partial [Coriobacteriales bacterium]